MMLATGPVHPAGVSYSRRKPRMTYTRRGRWIPNAICALAISTLTVSGCTVEAKRNEDSAGGNCVELGFVCGANQICCDGSNGCPFGKCAEHTPVHCAEFSGCDACASQRGCAYCATTGACLDEFGEQGADWDSCENLSSDPQSCGTIPNGNGGRSMTPGEAPPGRNTLPEPSSGGPTPEGQSPILPSSGGSGGAGGNTGSGARPSGGGTGANVGSGAQTSGTGNPQCTSLTACVSTTTHINPNGCDNGELAATMTNNCGQTAHCRICTTTGGVVNQGSCEATDIPAGATQSGESDGLWWCSPESRVRFACAAPNDDYRCVQF